MTLVATRTLTNFSRNVLCYHGNEQILNNQEDNFAILAMNLPYLQGVVTTCPQLWQPSTMSIGLPLQTSSLSLTFDACTADYTVIGDWNPATTFHRLHVGDK